MDRSAEATGPPPIGKAAAAGTLTASEVAATPHETPEAGRAGEGTPHAGRAGEGTPHAGRAGEGTPHAGRAGNETLAAGVAAGIERLIGLLRWLSPPSGLSLTSTATLATLERSGPARLTALAASEGVTQPAMTQLIARLEEAALVTRATDPADGRAVEVRITAEGQALLSRRRFYRAERLTGMLAELSPEQQLALAAALPAMDALTSAHRGVPLTAAQPS
jgi:DNA-binding MarR family transcriptional regulator